MILVTGATGTVGSEIVRQLAAGGHGVRAACSATESRPPSAISRGPRPCRGVALALVIGH
jgi:nucleoside-diphosphate-sugar epimerase